MGKGGSYPIGIFRPCPPGSQGIVNCDLGAGEVHDVFLGVFSLSVAEQLHGALKPGLKVFFQGAQLLLYGGLRQLTHGDTEGLGHPLKCAMSLRMAETEDETR
jgi:hypothetical protein